MGRMIALSRDNVRIQLEDGYRADVHAQAAALAEEVVDGNSRHGNLLNLSGGAHSAAAVSLLYTVARPQAQGGATSTSTG